MTDALSEVLRSVRLLGGVFLDARFTAPWCVNSRLAADDCRPLLAGPQQMIAYHFMLEGRMLVSVEGGVPVEVRAGEIVLLPRNDSHVLASAAGLIAVDSRGLVQPGAEGGLARVEHGGGGAPARLVCGFLGSDDGFNPLIAALPPILKVDLSDASRGWIESSLRFAAAELREGRLASSTTLSRLSELLFVEAVRHYAGAEGNADAGWLKGLRDPQIGRALALIHRDLAAPWTAEALAREVALSRSAFVERFSSAVGVPPIRYLTVWRLESAKQLLRSPARSVAAVAGAVGYESEEAFSRAFKREFGLAPTPWREAELAA